MRFPRCQLNHRGEASSFDASSNHLQYIKMQATDSSTQAKTTCDTSSIEFQQHDAQELAKGTSNLRLSFDSKLAMEIRKHCGRHPWFYPNS